MDKFYLDNFPNIVLDRQKMVYWKWLDIWDNRIYVTDSWLSDVAKSIIWDTSTIAAYISWWYDENRIIERWINFYQLHWIVRYILEKANQAMWYNWYIKNS